MPDFERLGLSAPLLAAIRDIGYETPTAIQAKTIPALRAGRDVMGQAQTGTGKTAAFAIPILEALELPGNRVPALVLTPTRELSIQVAEAIHTYSRHMGRVLALPVYGGQPIQQQLRRLRAGVHIVVGTPGRLMDHIRRGTLDLTALKIVVLDEAHEMLRMGFIEDVEWILGQMPPTRQTALFSATMPKEVR
jgi:ATP-dependent RNA helicase DeaD